MSVMPGTQGIKTVQAEYDFAKDGGATGTITLRAVDANGNVIPAGSVITGGYVDVETACASATGTIALQSEAAGDIHATAGQASWTTGRKSVVPAGTGATAVKTTVERNLKAVIATAAFTAGKFRVVLFYK
jgi:YbbR domain-containing protein